MVRNGKASRILRCRQDLAAGQQELRHRQRRDPGREPL